MKIRRATLAYLDAIESLWREMMDFHVACDDYFALAPEADRNHREYMAGLIQDDAKRIFVAEDNAISSAVKTISFSTVFSRANASTNNKISRLIVLQSLL